MIWNLFDRLRIFNIVYKELTQKPLSGLKAVKIGLTIHLVQYEFQIGKIVAEQMISSDNKLQVIQTQSYGQFVQNYLMQLFKLAQNVKLFYSCKIGQYPTFDQQFIYTYETESTRENQINQFRIFKKYKSTISRISIVEAGKQFIQQDWLHNNRLENSLFIQITKFIESMHPGFEFVYRCMLNRKIRHQSVQNCLIHFNSCHFKNNNHYNRYIGLTTNSTKNNKWIQNNKKCFDSQNIVKQPLWFEENIQINREQDYYYCKFNIFILEES
ncbi:unnamed protein product (macronuclear) [Paramecium tetraurelia]|uniref:HORMA domain-containing protein n=1 Tax=Paramecium tetraurelia TaxID=5888 RepID=A0CHT5_PARTE|nr:uncharacterized protein GSPATT00038454001 [Paramecium tetraurelia]CAK70352.1 unnamed protein product [Paramecium tetraurelia]|eukprot:XP_001437749.1 hypothetical protein (macronuclear) [Paramecium tetraurelia strain d4-2]